MTCVYCGEEMAIDDAGVATHAVGDGRDYDRDADHVPLDDAEYGWPPR